MDSHLPLKCKIGLQYGAIIAFITITVDLLFYVLNIWPSPIRTFTIDILLLAGLIISTIYYRNHFSADLFDFKTSYKTAFVIGLYFSIFFSIYGYFFHSFIGPEMKDFIYRIKEEKILDSNLLKDQDKEMQLIWAKRTTTSGFFAVASLLNSVFLSLIFSLLLSLFTKRSKLSQL